MFTPDWGGWHTVVTAASEAQLATSARLLGWQTGKRLRLVDPDGRVLREIPPGSRP